MTDPLRHQRRLTDPDSAAAEIQAIEQERAYLKQDLERVHANESDGLAASLREANERLVIAAMQAETLADSAFSRLDELSRVASSDTLTDTPNRATILDRIDTATALARRHHTRFAVIFVDLDGFKQINDTLGHEAGDMALRLVARRLESAVRSSDAVSRYGGDEFVVLLSEISHSGDAAFVAAKILEALTQPVDASSIRLGASLGVAIYPEDGEDVPTLLRNADAAMYGAKRRGGDCFEFSSRLTVDDLARRDEDARSRAGRDMSSHTVLRELGDLREANQRLVIAALAAQESEAASAEIQLRHSKFVSMVAHELRNPLAPLRACADLLQSSRLGEPGLAKVGAILVRQIGHLTRIIDDLLEGARVNEGKFRLQRRTIDLSSVIDAAVESCQEYMAARRQQFERRGQGDGTILLVDGDAVRLVQAFGNLLDNASKYTPSGGSLALDISATAEQIRVVISDNGIGMTAEMLPRVFELFAQDPDAVAVHGGGLGIGLAVVREIVLAHGGTVSAQSAGRGLGSVFEVVLPRLQQPRVAG